MSRRQKDPLRPLTYEERQFLEKLARAQSEPASHVARARALLAVAAGQSYTTAAQAAGRRAGDAVSQLVARFDRQGCAAVAPGHSGDRRHATRPLCRSAFWRRPGVHRIESGPHRHLVAHPAAESTAAGA